MIWRSYLPPSAFNDGFSLFGLNNGFNSSGCFFLNSLFDNGLNSGGCLFFNGGFDLNGGGCFDLDGTSVDACWGLAGGSRVVVNGASVQHLDVGEARCVFADAGALCDALERWPALGMEVDGEWV